MPTTGDNTAGRHSPGEQKKKKKKKKKNKTELGKVHDVGHSRVFVMRLGTLNARPFGRYNMLEVSYISCLYNFDPLKPNFYIVKLGFRGVNIIFLISAQNIDCGYSLEPPLR